MIDTNRLIRYAADIGVELTPTQAAQFDVYASLLVEWNEKMNLTAITDPEGMLVKHFLDSLTAVPCLPGPEGSLIDVGTGAGFPGVAIAIACPGIKLTLLDSLQKRLTFLDTLCRELGVKATLIHARAEEGGKRPELREQFDVATARAVAALPALCEYCLPFVRPGGRFIALKGPDAANECEAAHNAISLLGGRVTEVVEWSLPAGEYEGEKAERRLILLDKIAPTPPKYPRQGVKIAKSPL